MHIGKIRTNKLMILRTPLFILGLNVIFFQTFIHTQRDIQFYKNKLIWYMVFVPAEYVMGIFLGS